MAGVVDVAALRQHSRNCFPHCMCACTVHQTWRMRIQDDLKILKRPLGSIENKTIHTTLLQNFNSPLLWVVRAFVCASHSNSGSCRATKARIVYCSNRIGVRRITVTLIRFIAHYARVRACVRANVYAHIFRVQPHTKNLRIVGQTDSSVSRQ